MTLDTNTEHVESFEISPENLAFTKGADTRNIGIKHYLCLRDILPKTRLSQAILYENVSQRRQLGMKYEAIKTNKSRNLLALDFNRRAFQMLQERKRHKWKKDDELRVANMNLPVISVDSGRPVSSKVIYHLSEYKLGQEKQEPQVPLLPKMQASLRREQTEIISHREKTFMTKIPEVIEMDPKLLERHNTYCGKSFLDEGHAGKDNRFSKFITMLQPAKISSDDYPFDNVKPVNRFSKYNKPKAVKTPKGGIKSNFKSSSTKADKDQIARRFEAVISREYSKLSQMEDENISKFKCLTDKDWPELKGRATKKLEFGLERYKSDELILLKSKKPMGEDILETDEREESS
ncbi:hypothetical protein CHS0354_032014 [Potamilus streckersoni]|uniref:Uncharacterized protein n=1 Tax=Potamilus streckersoni TaxID=2493646 RepID=A0AAE0TL60_9BIVA|nr:hypothetical protein CHS0354_032014 [Potamilus streckersoni]